MNFDTVVQYFTTHPWLSLAAWLVLSATINMMLRKRTAEEWVTLIEERPRAAAIIRVFRAIGFDPAKLINALAEFLNAKARPKAVLTAIAVDDRTTAPDVLTTLVPVDSDTEDDLPPSDGGDSEEKTDG